MTPEKAAMHIDDEGQVCQNCGNVGHRKYDCPEQKNYTANIICRLCGQAGHMARDCIQRRGGMPPQNGPGGPPPPSTTPQFDSDYASLMAELGEKPSANGGPANGQGAWGAGGGPIGANVPPWRNPANWNPVVPMGGGYGGYQQRPGGYQNWPQPAAYP